MAPTGPDAYHIPAMPEEVTGFLNPHDGGVWLDNTVGGGGHARLICERLSSEAVFLGLDRDPLALQAAGIALEGCMCRVILRRAHFGEVARIVDELGEKLSGALWDLGLSSAQLERGAGFSFRDGEALLDMRQDPGQELTAAEVVNWTPEKDLADLIYQNADERFSRRIAASITRARPLETMGDLVAAVLRSLPAGYRQKDDVLRRVCQAIRMEVNQEIPQLEKSLEAVCARCLPGARIVLLSYHSGEDGIVKRFLRQEKLGGRLKVLTPKPLRPQIGEISRNPRARPARLRAAEILA